MFGWPFPRTLLSVDFHENYMVALRGKQALFHLHVFESFSSFFEDGKERLFNYRINHSIEDLVVTSANMDSVIFISTALPERARKREIENIGRMEAARNFGLAPEGIFVSLVGKVGNRGIFAVAKKDSLENAVIKPLMELGFEEPDVVIPDAFKYLYVYYIPKHGRVAYIIVNFFKDYFTVLLSVEGEIVGVRNASLEVSRVMDFLKSEAGVSLSDIVKMSEIGDERLSMTIRAELTDLAFEITRELSLLAGSGIVPVNLAEVDLRLLITDPEVFNKPLKEALEEAMQPYKVTEPSLRSLLKVPEKMIKLAKGAFGLLMRGAEEYGKIKSLHFKEEKS